MAAKGVNTGRRVDAQRRRRLRADARRPLGENLAEAIELSHKLHGFAGAVRRR